MSLSSLELLRDTIQSVQQRRSLFFNIRQISLVLVGIILLFLLMGYLEMTYQFSFVGRVGLLALFLSGMGALVWWNLFTLRKMKQNDQHLAHYVEEHIPDLEQRLMTSIEFSEEEKQGVSSQLVRQLWKDAHTHIKGKDLEQLTTTHSSWSAFGAAVLLLGSLVITLLISSNFYNASQRLVWPWSQAGVTAPLEVTLTIEPGDLKMQRGEDIALIATVENGTPQHVQLFLQNDRVNWEKISMPQEEDSNTYVYYLPSVKKDLTYYVDIGDQRSRQYHINLFDIPRVEQIDLAYQYPQYTGIPDTKEINGGDIVAPEGTEISISAMFNKPIQQAVIEFEQGQPIYMKIKGAVGTGSFQVTRDTTYSIKITDFEQLENKDPSEYFIKSIPDTPPELTLTQPGADRRVMSLEEVAIKVSAKDDYGLTKFILNYTVTGQAEQEIRFIEGVRQQQNINLDKETLIYLEDLQVEPGDFVTYFLTVADNNEIKGPAEVLSDIYFLEVISSEELFSRAAQQAGGGAGGGGRSGGGRGPSSALVENQKDIIAATWKLMNQKKKMSDEKFKNDLNIVTDSQKKVMQRSLLSLQRLSERLTLSDESYDRAVQHMKEAVDQMKLAVEKLEKEELNEAIAPEQAALQAIMKAQSDGRRTQIGIAQNRGGGAGGQQRERRDLSELFEMEMGRLENRYELPQRGGGRINNRQAAEDDSLSKLKELARRQEKLNRDQRNLARRQDQMTEEQKRRQLEQLRREQEELSRLTESLSRQMSQRSQRGRGGRSSSQQRQLQQAAQQMQDAARSLLKQDPQIAATKGRKALENLRNQQQKMNQGKQNQSLSQLTNALSQKAQQLQEQERKIQQNLKKMSESRQAKEGQQSSQTAQADRSSTGSSPTKEGRAEEKLVSKEINEVIADKEQQQHDLAEIEKMLRAISARGDKDDPRMSSKATNARRLLNSEKLDNRIQKSKEMLKEGMLNLSKELENRISKSINRVSDKLLALDQGIAQSKEDQLQQAASDASDLRRELENLRKQVEAQRQSIRQQLSQQQGQQNQQGQQREGNQSQGGTNLSQARDGLQRIQRYADGLIRPYFRGQNWIVNARSVHRDVSKKTIEDFLNQPDLWKKLLEPIKELEAKLKAQAEIEQLNQKLFTTLEEEVPVSYKQQVEEYYRSLSQTTHRLQ